MKLEVYLEIKLVNQFFLTCTNTYYLEKHLMT